MHFWSSLFLMSKMTFLFQMHPPLQTKQKGTFKTCPQEYKTHCYMLTHTCTHAVSRHTYTGARLNAQRK